MSVSPHDSLLNKWNVIFDFIERLLNENNIYCLQKNRNQSWDRKIFCESPFYRQSVYLTFQT